MKKTCEPSGSSLATSQALISHMVLFEATTSATRVATRFSHKLIVLRRATKNAACKVGEFYISQLNYHREPVPTYTSTIA